jgi:hypothetical protein
VRMPLDSWFLAILSGPRQLLCRSHTVSSRPFGDVTLPAGDVFEVMGIDEENLNAAGLKNLIHRNPVNARGLHRYGANTAGLEPIRKLLQILGKGWEAAHGSGSRSAGTATNSSLAPTSIPAASGCNTGRSCSFSCVWWP